VIRGAVPTDREQIHTVIVIMPTGTLHSTVIPCTTSLWTGLDCLLRSARKAIEDGQPGAHWPLIEDTPGSTARVVQPHEIDVAPHPFVVGAEPAAEHRQHVGDSLKHHSHHTRTQANSSSSQFQPQRLANPKRYATAHSWASAPAQPAPALPTIRTAIKRGLLEFSLCFCPEPVLVK
jgi:hypothetical protein